MMFYTCVRARECFPECDKSRRGSLGACSFIKLAPDHSIGTYAAEMFRSLNPEVRAHRLTSGDPSIVKQLSSAGLLNQRVASDLSLHPFFASTAMRRWTIAPVPPTTKTRTTQIARILNGSHAARPRSQLAAARAATAVATCQGTKESL